MSTSAQVRTAWFEKVWSDESVLEFTERIFLHDVIVDSEFDVELLHHEQQINFITCIVQRAHEAMKMGQTRYQYQVQVLYHLQQSDVEGSTFNDVQDRIEIVDGLVISALGSNWNSTVDYYTGSNARTLELITISGKRCWRGGYTYSAFKTT